MKGEIIIKTHINGDLSIKTRMTADETDKEILMHMIAKSLKMSPNSIFKWALLEISGYFDKTDEEAKTKGILKTWG